MKSVPELKSLFDGVVEENRQVLRKKLHEKSKNAGVDAFSMMIEMLADEISYIKSEQMFERIYNGNHNIFDSPIGVDSAHLNIGSFGSYNRGLRSAEINMSGFFHGRSWHNLEWSTHNKIGFRWTDGLSGFINLKVDRRSALIAEFEVYSMAQGNSNSDISITLDDKPLTTNYHQPFGASCVVFWAEIESNPDLSGTTHTFELRCLHAITPAQIDSKSADQRSLGLAVNSFRIYPKY